MKKGTLLIWVIIFGFIALVIFQNKAFFLESKTSISLNLGITEAYQAPELPNAVIVLFFFGCGIIIAYLFSFSARFKSKRTIKRLNLTIASHINELAELKSEINTLKGIEEPVDDQGKTTKLDLNDSRKIADETGAGSSPEKTVKFGADDTASNPGEDTDTGETLIREKD